MSGPGDPAWERRQRIVRGEPAEGDEKTPAESGSSPSFTGAGPAGESTSSGPEVGTDADSKQDDDEEK